MKSPDFPSNEQERIATLHSTNLLDTSFEERFDRVTRIAKNLFDVSIALVSLVDNNRQWFKSCIGLDVRETSREISFCGHAILNNHVFVIEDTYLDDRFKDNPLVTQAPFIRFYAGYPLKMSNGIKIGTLCIIDQNPRKFTKKDESLLIDLGNIVESELSTIDYAVKDELTDLFNVRGLKLLMKNNISLLQREHSSSVIVFLDLDQFKKINDTFGHKKGDEVLKDFAAFLKSSCRNSDVVARVGGDEFIMMLNNISIDKAKDLMLELNELVMAYNESQTDDIELLFSYGLEKIDTEIHLSIDDIIKRADEKMYLNKKQKQ